VYAASAGDPHRPQAREPARPGGRALGAAVAMTAAGALPAFLAGTLGV